MLPVNNATDDVSVFSKRNFYPKCLKHLSGSFL